MHPDDVLNNKYFSVFPKTLKLVFLWPYQKMSNKYFGRMVIFFIIHTMMIPQIRRGVEEFYEPNPDIVIIVENICGFIYFQMVLLNMYVSIFAEKKLKQLYEEITRDFESFTDVGERNAIRQSWDVIKFLYLFYSGYVIIGVGVFVSAQAVLPTILNMLFPVDEPRIKKLCYFAEYFVDEQEYFYYLFLHTVIVVSLTGAVHVAVGTSYFGCVYHTLGRFDILM
ncbi:hypothetical protein QAD02_011059 [Eretmocerus hayati]|uniref:Uncharacterized protein n=1 Tax=Eretmocerus hayati TaxID=131215 RepID=A0ACC2NWP4_9HYME|nr:hypothetical protein QAD02_011059 [Eretmocerus hayati]